MVEQVESGKAFEYACLQEIYRLSSLVQKTIIISSSATQVAQEFYSSISTNDPDLKKRLDQAAEATAKFLLKYEPMISSPSKSPLYLCMQSDQKGEEGDARDIICCKPDENWEIGISCKHNHDAVKHSRLSMNIKFGELWFDTPNDREYFEEISPIFKRLDELKKKGALWRNIPDKEASVYIPLLDAFINEMNRLCQKQPEIAKRLVRYMIGCHDFYKVETIDKDKITAVVPYNLSGTLNRPNGSVTPKSKFERQCYPNRIIEIKRIKNNTVQIICDEGWSFTLRIHNAKSAVEASLKFDARVKGIPKSIGRILVPWNE